MRPLLDSLHAQIQRLDGETQQVMRFVLAACAEAGQRVLDVACGHGRFLTLLNGAGLEATGVDINPKSVAKLRDAGLDCLSVDELNGSAKKYDVLLMAHIIEHFSPDALLPFLDGYLDRLKEGGRLVIATPLMTDYFYDDFDHIRPYQPVGIQMVFGEGMPQVQYYSRNKLVLRDIWFRRSPKRLSHARGRYFPGSGRSLVLGLELLAGVAFLLSARLVGTTDGWVGVFEKTRG